MIQPSPFREYQFYRGGASSAVLGASKSSVSRESIYGDDDFNNYSKDQVILGGASSAVLGASKSAVSRESIYGDDDFNDYAKDQVILGGSGPVINAGFPVASIIGAGAGLARFANLTVPAGLVIERRVRVERAPLSEEYALCAIEELQFSRLFSAIADIQSNSAASSGQRTAKSSRKIRGKKTRKTSS